jgi:hypothetical protein
MSDVKAANAGPKVGSGPCERPVGLIRNLPHRVGENGGGPLRALRAPTLGACRKDVRKIDLRWSSKPKPRHAP